MPIRPSAGPCWIPCFVLLLTALTWPPAATALPDVVIGQGAAQAGAIAEVPVAFFADGETTALQLQVVYDPSLLEPQAVLPGAALTDHVVDWLSPAPGALILVVYSPSLAPIGSDTLVDLAFAVDLTAPEGETPVTVATAVLADADAELVTATQLEAGTVTIRQSGIVEVPTTSPLGLVVLALLLAIAGLVMRGRGGSGGVAWIVLIVLGTALLGTPVQAGAPGDADNSGFIDAGDAPEIAAEIVGAANALGDADCTMDGAVDVRDIVCAIGFEAGPPPSVVVTPGVATMSPGDILAFEAAVSGTTNTDVTWNVTDGTLSASGNSALYSPPETPGTYQIIATSNANPNLLGVATITVEGEPSIQFVSEIPLLSTQMPSATLEVEVLDGDGAPIPGALIDWTASDPSIVTVTSTGAGTADVAMAGASFGFSEITASYQGLHVSTTIVVAELDPSTVLLFEGDVMAAAKLATAPAVCERFDTVGSPEVFVPPVGMPQDEIDALEVGDFTKDATRQFRVVQVVGSTITVDELLPPEAAVAAVLARNPRTEALQLGDVLFSIGDNGGTLGRVLSIDLLPGRVEIVAGLTCYDEIFNELQFAIEPDAQALRLETHSPDPNGEADGILTLQDASGRVTTKLFSSRFQCSGSLRPKDVDIVPTSLFDPRLRVLPTALYDNGRFYLGLAGQFNLDVAAGEFEIGGTLALRGGCTLEIREFKLPVFTIAKIMQITIDFEFSIGFQAKASVAIPRQPIFSPTVQLRSTAIAGICHDVRQVQALGITASCRNANDFGYFGEADASLQPSHPLQVPSNLVQAFNTLGGTATVRLEGFAQLDIGLSLTIDAVFDDIEIIGIDFLRFRAGGFGQLEIGAPTDSFQKPYNGPTWAVGPFIEARLIFDVDNSSLVGRALQEASSFLKVPLKILSNGIQLYQRDFPVLRSARPELFMQVDGQVTHLVDLRTARNIVFGMRVPPQIGGVPVYVPDGFGAIYIARNGGPINRNPLGRVLGPGPGDLWSVQWLPAGNETGLHEIFGRLEAGAPPGLPYAQISPLQIQVIAPGLSVPRQITLQPLDAQTSGASLAITNPGTAPVEIQAIRIGPNVTAPRAVLPIVIPPGATHFLTLRAPCTNQPSSYGESLELNVPGTGAFPVTAQVLCGTAPPNVVDLKIDKTGPASLQPGQPIQYRLVVSNNAGAIANDAVVTDVVPQQITNVRWSCAGSGQGSTCFGSGGSGNTVSQRVTLAPNGQPVTILVDGVVSPSIQPGTLLFNEARVDPPSGVVEQNPTDNTSSVTTNVGGTVGGGSPADLFVSKLGPPSLQPGQPVTYTINVTNSGPAAADPVTLQDTVPTLITNVSWTCAASGGAICQTGGGSGNNVIEAMTLPSRGVAVVTVHGTLSPTAPPTTFENIASLVLPPGLVDLNLSNNSSRASTVITSGGGGGGGAGGGSGPVDLSLTKVGPPTASPGSSVTYWITASNSGPGTAVGATVTDDLPSFLTGVGWTCAPSNGASCITGGGTGNRILETVTLPPGSSAAVTVTATVAPGTPPSGFTNLAIVTPPAGVIDSNPSNNSASSPLSIGGTAGGAQADLSITKTGPTSLQPGDPVTYTITASNAGPGTASATVSDTVAPQITGVTWTCAAAGGATCTTGGGSGNTVAEAVSLPPGGSVTLTVTGSLSGSASGSLSNLATVQPTGGASDPNPSNNSDRVDTTIGVGGGQADLALSKTGPPSAHPADPITFTVVATNHGPAAADATVTDIVTPLITGVTWTCAAAGGGACNTGGGSGSSVMEAVHLPAGGSVTLTIQGVVGTGVAGTLDNYAVINPVGIVDPNPANNSAGLVVPVGTGGGGGGTQADLAIVKVGPPSLQPGDPVTYTLTVNNHGPATATHATVRDVVSPLITGITWTCTPTGGASCTGGNGSGNSVFETMTIPFGASVAITIRGTLDPNAPAAPIVNTATVAPAAGTTDPNPANDTSTVNSTVIGSGGSGPVDLAITKTGPPSVQAGDPLQYTITVVNNSPGSASASIYDGLPGIVGGGWTCSASGGASCDTGGGSGVVQESVTLPAGASVTLTTSGTLDPMLPGGNITNVATVSPVGTVDSNPSNNTASVLTSFGSGAAGADLGITKSGPQSVPVSSPLNYTLTVTNAGPETATGATVTDLVAPVITGVTWTCTPSVGASCGTGAGSGNAVSETVTIPAGGSVTIQITGTSPSFELPAPGLGNSANVLPAAGATDPNPVNNTSSVTTVISGGSAFGADLAITKTGPASVEISTPLAYTVTVANSGPETATGALISDDVASVVTGVTWTCAPAGGATCNTGGGAGNAVREMVTLPSGGSVVLTISGTAPAFPIGGSGINNTASVGVPPGVADPDLTNNTSSVQTVINDSSVPGGVDLTITKAGPASVPPSSPLSYTLTVSNIGPDTATHATVRDEVAPVVTGVTWTCVPTGGATCDTGGGSGNSVAELVTLPAGGSVTITVHGTAPPFEVGGLGINNTASVDVPPGSNDTHPADNTSSVLTLITNGSGGGGSGAKRLFVTSQAFSSNFGGLGGADVACQQAAGAAGLSGSFKAWLSDSTANVKDRLIASSGAYELVDGTTVAASFADLIHCPAPYTGCAIQHAIDKDEHGNTVSNVFVWTGSFPDGTADAAYNHCLDWTSDVPAQGAARSGNTSSLDFGWTALGVTNCDGAGLGNRLYCIEQ